jgi:hypothetical protein
LPVCATFAEISNHFRIATASLVGDVHLIRRCSGMSGRALSGATKLAQARRLEPAIKPTAEKSSSTIRLEARASAERI